MLFYKKSFIVSCQSDGNDPFNSPKGVASFARAAEMGGADGIRSEGVEKTKEILKQINLPVIGLIKSNFKDGYVRITGSFNDVEKLIETGCQVIAIDGTFREREGKSGPEFIQMIKTEYNCKIMADISNLEEALACQKAGADCVSTTLNGYTPTSLGDNNGEPNFQLVKKLVNSLQIPIFAEGRISTPEQAKKLMDIGAYGVVVGTMITRPRIITERFVEIIKYHE
jgi:N-acylglucosamine-6-phosphate 2-epimerase